MICGGHTCVSVVCSVPIRIIYCLCYILKLEHLLHNTEMYALYDINYIHHI
jgi:hypothetical protein